MIIMYFVQKIMKSILKEKLKIHYQLLITNNNNQMKMQKITWK